MTDMLDKFDEADLLAFIEDELHPDRAAQVHRRLAGDPKMLAFVERLQDDRQLLQSMDEPVVPADLMAELEPMMARPMLMPEPGEWRRRYRKRRPWKRYAAVAAVVALTLLAGVWATTSGLIGFGRPAGSTPAVTDGALRIEPDVALAEATGADPWPPAETVIHHHAPGAGDTVAAAESLVTADRPGPERRRRARGEVPQLTAARFVLVSRRQTDPSPAGPAAIYPAWRYDTPRRDAFGSARWQPSATRGRAGLPSSGQTAT